MSTGKHYFIERTAERRYAVRSADSEHASSILDTQAEAIAYAKKLNPDDQPNISRVKHTSAGKPDQWR